MITSSGEAIASEHEVYEAAADLIAEYGSMACAYVSMEADERLEDGDIDGHDWWKRVMFAIGEMLATRCPEGITIH